MSQAIIVSAELGPKSWPFHLQSPSLKRRTTHRLCHSLPRISASVRALDEPEEGWFKFTALAASAWFESHLHNCDLGRGQVN